MMNFEITQSGLTMKCRLFQRQRHNSWVLSGTVNSEERMSCDVTATVRKHHGVRMMQELMTTASQRLRQIAADDAIRA
jgi:hypothetical protein